MLRGVTALYNYKGPLAPGLNFVKNALTLLPDINLLKYLDQRWRTYLRSRATLLLTNKQAGRITF